MNRIVAALVLAGAAVAAAGASAAVAPLPAGDRDDISFDFGANVEAKPKETVRYETVDTVQAVQRLVARARKVAAAGGTVATYYWFTQTPLYQNTRIVDLPWQEIMPALMLTLAAMMISSVPYPTWPKVGVRSLPQVGGLALVLALVFGLYMRLSKRARLHFGKA